LKRRLRNLFGIRAPRVAIRTYVPWQWRVLSVLMLLGMFLAFAIWVYDAGRRFAGFDSSESEHHQIELREKVAALESELSQVRNIANVSDSNLRIERAAQEQLSKQVKALEAENLRLREDLAIFESMAKEGLSDTGPSISRLSVSPGDGGSYHFRLLVARQAGKKDRDFHGSYQLVLNIQRQGSNAMMTLPKAEEADRYQLVFRHFRRVEGNFSIPADARLVAVEARLIQNGVIKARQRVQL